jgi:hypothetical protein
LNKEERMRYTRLTSVLLAVVVLFVFIGPIGRTQGNDGQDFGIATSNGVETYKSKTGEIYTITIDNGKKYVNLQGVEFMPLEDFLACESGETDRRLLKDLSQGKALPPTFDAHASLARGQDGGYNQKYGQGLGYGWADTQLGNGPGNIGPYGCFLCSVAECFRRYGLKISGQDIAPLNLNSWLTTHGCFNRDDLQFPLLTRFPGISTVYNGFNSFYDAGYLISQGSGPIICLQSYAHSGLHFCLYVTGNGSDPYVMYNGHLIVYQGPGQLHEVVDSARTDVSNPANPKGYINDLYHLYAGSGQYYRTGTSVFRVAIKS